MNIIPVGFLKGGATWVWINADNTKDNSEVFGFLFALPANRNPDFFAGFVFK
jgi:hypothetical protein